MKPMMPTQPSHSHTPPLHPAQATIRSTIAEISAAEPAAFALDIVRCTNPSDRHHMHAGTLASTIVDKIPFGDPTGPREELPATLFDVTYFNQSVKHVGTAGYGFYSILTTKPVLDHILSLSWTDFVFQGDVPNKDTDTLTTYKLVVQPIEVSDIPTGTKRTTTSMNWFNIRLNTEAKTMCLKGLTTLEGLTRVHLNGANMRLTKFERLMDKITQTNLPTVRGEFELKSGWFPTDMKKALTLSIASDKNTDLTLEVGKQFCDEHGIHFQCLKLNKTREGTAHGDYCSCGRAGRGPSDMGARREQLARAQAAFQERRNKRKALADPFE